MLVVVVVVVVIVVVVLLLLLLSFVLFVFLWALTDTIQVSNHFYIDENIFYKTHSSADSVNILNWTVETP